jgi:hypothetical protein
MKKQIRISSDPHPYYPYKDLDDLSAVGYSIFRNGKIVAPSGHTSTEDEIEKFNRIKQVYPYVRLIDTPVE